MHGISINYKIELKVKLYRTSSSINKRWQLHDDVYTVLDIMTTAILIISIS